MTRRAWLGVLLVAGCGDRGAAVAIPDGASAGADGASSPEVAAIAVDGPSPPDAAIVDFDAPAVSDTTGGQAEAQGTFAVEAGGRDFSAVAALVGERAAAAGVTTMGLAIWDASDTKIYEQMLGGFTADTRVAVASASKLVSGLVLFDLVRRGLLGLDSSTGEVLAWPAPNSAINLRQLLSFTSGLPSEAACTLNPLTTLANCAATLATATPLAAPGTEFDYGSTHLLVAAAMAEQVTGLRFAELFALVLQRPLGLPAEVAYFTAPRQAVGQINPLVAGGLRASMNEYHHFLALAFHRGSYAGLDLGTAALFADQAREPYPDVVIGNSPLPAFRYGLAAWLECPTPATGCQVLASPGAFGFTPWFDRATGYYAILGMELESTGSDEGVVAFSVNLQADLQPLIVAALAK
jgi:D-alanyl-D-alanine-carboxypeptidase/D-alanyl-D-alanine-endopeptidase